MRYAVISDIHGNLEALEAVLAHIQKRGIQEIVCLGDVIGYGPNPIECLVLVMENVEVCLKGNHDEAFVEGVYFFNTIAKSAIRWSLEEITKSDHPRRESIIEFLRSLPLTYTRDKNLFVHASPLDPTGEYIHPQMAAQDPERVIKIFSSFETNLFVGHTHFPCVITESLQTFDLKQLGYKYQSAKEKSIINVGSVGQPRDKDPRASYLEVIDDIYFFHRVPYEIEKTQEKIRINPSLDNSLAERLLLGK